MKPIMNAATILAEEAAWPSPDSAWIMLTLIPIGLDRRERLVETALTQSGQGGRGMIVSDFRPSPITKLFPIAVGAFGWQVHGLWIGIGLALAFVAVAISSNALVLSRSDENKADDDSWVWARKIQRRQWIIFLAFILGIAFSGYEVIEV